MHRYRARLVSVTDLVFELRLQQTSDLTAAPEDSVVVQIDVPEASGGLATFDLFARDLSMPDHALAASCEYAGWDVHYCVPDLIKHTKIVLDKACATLGLPTAPLPEIVGAWSFASSLDTGDLGPRRFVVGGAWRLPKLTVRRYVLSLVRAFRPNTRTSVVLMCLPADMRMLHDLASELGPLTAGVGAEVNLHIYPCLGKQVGSYYFFRYSCLTKVLSLTRNMAGSALDVDPNDLVILSDIRDVRSVPVCACTSRAHGTRSMSARTCIPHTWIAGVVPSRPV
jgi:hypothetical protein